jgi:secreted trypsin-like serine protease
MHLLRLWTPTILKLPFSLSADCGEENWNPEDPKVVGGTEAQPGQFPWLVAIYCGGKWFCTGSLISENYVLTAAHCVDGIGMYQ